MTGDRGASRLTVPATVTEALASFAMSTRLEDIAPAAREAATLLLLDAIGTALVNRDAPFAVAMRTVVAEADAGGPCTVIGGSERGAGPEAAAEVNSSLVHGSDLDATHIESIIHPTSIAVPVALAVGEAADARGSEVLAAIACGMEVLVRLGLAAAGQFHRRGYQPTALLGSIVAAIVAARLRGRSTGAAVEAAGLATSVSAGLRSFSSDGTWGKRLITAWACRTGIHAEALVAAGFRGSRDALEKSWGLFPAFLPEGGFDLSLATDQLGRTWTLIDTEPKRYPCSHGLHPYIESARALSDQVSSDAIVTVGLRVNEAAVRWWFEPHDLRYRPDAYAARFSLPYTVARAILDGRVDEASFEAAAVQDSAALALADKVVPIVEPALADRAPVGLPGGLEVVLRDGTAIEIANAPAPSDTKAFVIERFRVAATGALGTGRAVSLERSILGIAGAPSVRTVLADART